jgi:subtilisin family serine protease
MQLSVPKKLLTAFLCFTLTASVWQIQAQDKDTAPDNWFNLDLNQNKVNGVSSEKAYNELLKDKKPKKKIIVAIIDSGVEADHEDLKEVMWVNKNEIANNNIDDDKNGYVDDINGWNFIGGKNGNVAEDSYELTRVYSMLKAKKKRSKKEQKEYERLKKAYEEKTEDLKNQYLNYAMIKMSLEIVDKVYGRRNISLDDLSKLDDKDEEQAAVKPVLKYLLEEGMSLTELGGEITQWGEQLEKGLKFGYNEEFNPRTVIGDDATNIKQRFYGNNDVEGPDAEHGTHVAGIVAASRTNEKGMKGVANYVEIMAIRAVPDGDERDKDIANAIRYAVDNGAQVVNMSFGKGLSPNKNVVDEAVKYAQKKGVLLVHAAGNSAQNIDNELNFPTRSFKKYNGKKKANNWIEVGALGWQGEEKAPADFSNYGKKNVDLFAPGVDIYSTIPNNGYKPNSGTSMAAPVVAGVAALVWSYYPELTAVQIREVLLKSAVKIDAAVNIPGGKEQTNFQDLSATGGVINVVKALELAEKMLSSKK